MCFPNSVPVAQPPLKQCQTHTFCCNHYLLQRSSCREAAFQCTACMHWLRGPHYNQTKVRSLSGVADSRSLYAVQSMRDIVGKCLIKDASKRPSAAQLLEHKFFKVAFPGTVCPRHEASAHGIDHVTSGGKAYGCTLQSSACYAWRLHVVSTSLQTSGMSS